MRLVGVLPVTSLDGGRGAGASPERAGDLRRLDLLELRLDEAPAPAFEAGEGPWGLPWLATVRSAAQGGAFEGTPVEAAARLADAARRGAAWLDAEAEVVEHLRPARAAGTRVLASVHGTGPVALPREGVDAWKVARPVLDAASLTGALEEARRLALAFLAGEGPPAFVVPYGLAGMGLRVVTAAVAEAAGIDPWVYGRLAGGDEAEARLLAGVPRLSELEDHGRLGEVSHRARLYGLLGRPPSRSPSPALHDAVFRSLGLDAVYLPAADLRAADGLALPYEGFGVTTPLKEDAAARCDVLDPVAARCGAVNTVVRDATGRLHGSNTDALAVLEAVRERGALAGTALVVGGGGFARAAVAALVEAGLSARIAGASARTRRAADHLRVEACGDDLRSRATDVVVVNATPVGADGRLSPEWGVLLAGLGPGTLVVDGPYAAGGAPAAVAEAARARGLAAEDGGSLLVRQAVGQALRFTGRVPDPAVLRCALDPQRNLVLVGPRGAGKTSVGRAVARRLGRPFVDTDESIARVRGRPAGRVLAEDGEPAFRALESREALRALARRGAVVSLGGGALLREEVRAAVAATGFAVRLTVEPAEAARRIASDATPRPRLTREPDLAAECARLAAEREPLFRAAAQAGVATDGRGVEEVAIDLLGLAHAAFSRFARTA